MKLIDKVKSFFFSAGNQQFQTEDDLNTWINGGYSHLNLYPKGSSVYENINHVGNAIEILASEYAKLPIKLLDRRDETKQTEINNTEFLDFINDASYDLNQRTFIKQLFTVFFTYGELYLQKEIDSAYGVHRGFDKLKFLCPISTYPQDRYGLIYKGTRRSYPIMRYQAFDGLRTYFLGKDEVLTAKNSSPYNNNRGLSVIERNITEVDSFYFLNILQKAQFSKGAMGSLFIESEEGFTQKQKNEFLKSFMRDNAGAMNAGKPTILPEKTKASRLVLSDKDFKFLDNKNMGRDTIYGAFCIPEEISGFRYGNNSTNGTAKDRREKINNFYLRTLPRLASDVLDLLTDVARTFDPNITVDFEYTVADLPIEEKSEMLNKLVLSGVITRNEAREQLPLNLDPLPEEEGDVVFAPANLIPLGQSAMAIADGNEPIEEVADGNE